MEILEVKDNQELNSFVAGQKLSQFLQSGQWADFQKSLNRKVWSLVVKDNQKIMASAIIIKYPMPFGQHYLYCPRGPVFNNQESLELLFNKMKELAKKEDSAFLKVEPPVKTVDYLKKNSFKESASMQPKNNLILDLSKSEEELLNSFHQKTRYNIRLAEKKGVKVRTSTDQKEIDVFWQLIRQTTERDKFSSHNKEYYTALIEKLGNENMLKLYIAEYEGKVLAVNINIFFGDTCVYLHGASSNQSRQLMAPHLLQWQAIKDTKKLGYRYYDFGGVAPENIERHTWAGVTRFKQGFNGQRVDYVGTWDLPIKGFWYNIYRLVKKVR